MTLGRSQAVADFLSPTYAGGRDGAGRKGIFAKLAESFIGPQKLPSRDIEDFFQNEVAFKKLSQNRHDLKHFSSNCLA